MQKEEIIEHDSGEFGKCIFGLGADGNVYRWHIGYKKWIIYEYLPRYINVDEL